ncbi:hypothetical protein M430DRAFT_166159 [Amorphotheca resinae ATCC 22711]|uniref:Uncharacterized protein n=1 Tax=Amorphotheca resinae ATCC 22711 TaxID=857342 RepID=A0A2T3BG98_AMORE|nr:hypothetical protein M430DRAFT_166159 [Amorphotheca resinae ATCC 22711]PSS28353.1 hypothetical protein M430DRAFT_166159 [Amorphotheca resinae ATCC 22711]
MDYSEENSGMRTSQARQLSRIPSPGKGLSEISDSQSNARSKHPSKMPQPTSIKHKIGPSFNEPEAKRKTLAERAGEPRSIAVAAPSSRPVVKGTSLAGAVKSGLTRNQSFSSSVSSKAPSASSRHTSNSSFSSSVGPGSRPVSAYHIPRPQTSMAFNRSAIARPLSTVTSRPATSMGNNSEDDDISIQGRRKGRPTKRASSDLQKCQAAINSKNTSQDFNQYGPTEFEDQ